MNDTLSRDQMWELMKRSWDGHSVIASYNTVLDKLEEARGLLRRVRAQCSKTCKGNRHAKTCPVPRVQKWLEERS